MKRKGGAQNRGWHRVAVWQRRHTGVSTVRLFETCLGLLFPQWLSVGERPLRVAVTGLGARSPVARAKPGASPPLLPQKLREDSEHLIRKARRLDPCHYKHVAMRYLLNHDYHTIYNPTVAFYAQQIAGLQHRAA